MFVYWNHDILSVYKMYEQYYLLLQAEAITLTVAQAFNIAYEKWQVNAVHFIFSWKDKSFRVLHATLDLKAQQNLPIPPLSLSHSRCVYLRKDILLSPNC